MLFAFYVWNYHFLPNLFPADVFKCWINEYDLLNISSSFGSFSTCPWLLFLFFYSRDSISLEKKKTPIETVLIFVSEFFFAGGGGNHINALYRKLCVHRVFWFSFNFNLTNLISGSSMDMYKILLRSLIIWCNFPANLFPKLFATFIYYCI